MADIVKKTGGQMAPWDPMRAMREFLRWDPFREMTPALPSLDLASFNPSFDVTENSESFVFKADLPGVNKDEIEITAREPSPDLGQARDQPREQARHRLHLRAPVRQLHPQLHAA